MAAPAATARPPRRMPSLKAMAKFLGVEGREPFCFRCGVCVDADSWADARRVLERAHVIDRVFDGLDNLANLRPLCSTCHRWQPIFKAGDEAEALAWFAPPSQWTPSRSLPPDVWAALIAPAIKMSGPRQIAKPRAAAQEASGNARYTA